jgi:hypothetical protein
MDYTKHGSHRYMHHINGWVDLLIVKRFSKIPDRKKLFEKNEKNEENIIFRTYRATAAKQHVVCSEDDMNGYLL